MTAADDRSPGQPGNGTVPTVPYRLVDTDSSLASACEQWSRTPWLAVDTEFIRTSTFYPEVGLIQIGDGRDVWLIDPLSITDWSAFAALMTDQDTTKVFHSCSEDLLVFIAFLGLMPTPVFDTQIAASFLGQGLSLSYQNLVQAMCDIGLPKGETRSDWLQRPLSTEQLQYAALDVLYLPDIARRQAAALEEAGRMDWAREEFERVRLLYDSELSGDFAGHYRNIRMAWQLQGRQLLALKLLAEWREKRARERNKPRNWIVRDAELQRIATAMPDSMQALADCAQLHPGFLRHEGERVLELIREARDAPDTMIPEPLPRPLTQGQKKRYKRIKSLVEDCAERLSLPVELLGRKKLLVDYIQSTDATGERKSSALPAELREGWRGTVLLPLLDREEVAHG